MYNIYLYTPLQSIKVAFRITLKTPQSGTLMSLKHPVKMSKRSPLSPLLLKAKVKAIPSKDNESGSLSIFT